MLSNRNNIQGFTNSGLNGPQNNFSSNNVFIITGNLETTVEIRLVFTQPIVIYWGDNTSTVPVSGISSTKTYSSPYSGNILITGGISGITQFVCDVGNISFDVGGVINFFPYLTRLEIRGTNTTFGSINNLPILLTIYENRGANVTSGSINNLTPNIIRYINTGNNTTTGAISSTPANIIEYVNTGLNTTSGYSTKIWAINQERILSRPTIGFGLTSAQVDQILIDLSAVTVWAGVRIIDLRGNNGPRTALSNPAVLTLSINGVTVLTN